MCLAPTSKAALPKHSRSYDSEPDADRESGLGRLRNPVDPKSALILAACDGPARATVKRRGQIVGYGRWASAIPAVVTAGGRKYSASVGVARHKNRAA